MVEKFSPATSEKVFTLGLNKRLNTTGLKIPSIAEKLYELNMTFPQLYAIPEQDDWLYPDGYSMVCSSFVVAMWKHGGLFDPYTI